MLGVNFGYHSFLMSIAGIDESDDLLLSHRSLLPAIIIAYCVAPAIIEEFFFRHICLGVFRRNLDVHTSVFVTSMMFGLLHIGVPVSAPILAVIGIGFGYARVYSGGILLPILLHFFHNLFITLWEIS